MHRIFFFITYLFLFIVNLPAQNYNAIKGSSFAGSLGVTNNPASIVNTPFPWDITLFSFQEQTSTNLIRVLNYSLLSSPANSVYIVNGGDYSRYANINFNLHLLNARVAINRKHAVAFGVNLRGYGEMQTGDYNFSDSLTSLRSFLNVNGSHPSFNGNMKSSAWVEVTGTYSGTFWDNEAGRMNGGITVKINRGLSGAFAGLENAGAQRIVQNSEPAFLVKSGNARYGYSANYDTWNPHRSTSQNLNDFFKVSKGSLSVDLGFEYIVKSQAVINFSDEESYYDYEWKIGAALLDIGSNQYKYGNQSRRIDNPKTNISDVMLQKKFTGINSVQGFNDTLSTVVNNVTPLSGKFRIINPARLVLNADRYLFDDFYINGEASLNLTSIPSGNDQLYSSEISLFSLTPRWETKKWGVYLPVLYNSQRQLWIGGAFKAGPLLLGIHNWANVFAKNKMQNGGGYVAVLVRPKNTTRTHRDRRNDCP